MEYIKFENINKYYGNIHVLKDINMTVEQGELVTLLGPSGCGKSTLLRCLSGLEQVSSGKIYLMGRDVTDVSPKEREIGMVFQQYSLFPNMTVAENVAFGLKMKKVPKDQIHQKVKDMLKVVGLADQKNKYPSQLSGGQQQRVALARAIVTEPKVLLLDEPLSAIDALLRRNLQMEIRRLHKEFHITTLFVTHDQDEAMVMSDTIHLLYNGRVEQSGSPVEVYTRPATAFAANFIGHYNYFSAEDFEKITGKSFPAESVAFRPEVIEIIKEKPEEKDAFRIHGVIANSLAHGNIMRYGISCGGIQVDVDTLFSNEKYYRPGEEVWLDLPEKDCIIY